jgi:hypothetical protein
MRQAYKRCIELFQKDKRMHWNKLLTAFVIPLICACNFSSMSFNLGKLLLPGESMVTAAVGERGYYEIKRQENWFSDSSTSIGRTNPTYDTSNFYDISAAIDYRLGVLSKFPFGKGAEIGFLVEFPAQMTTSAGLPLLQFDARMGLPLLSLRSLPIHHNLDLGWIVGEWIDNGWFAEYAAGLEIGKCIPYGNVRITRTPTDRFDQSDIDDIEFLVHHNRRWNARACFGISIQLPRWIILPDFIVPEIALFYPNAAIKRPGISGHVGIRWQYGF